MRSLLFTQLVLIAAASWGGDALAQRAESAPAELSELRGMRGQLDGKLKNLNATRRAIDEKQSQLSTTRESIARLQADNDRARAKLKQLRDVEDANPDSIQPATMNAAVNDNRETFARVAAAKAKVGKLEGELLDLRGGLNQQSAEIEQLRRSYDNALDVATERQVSERIRGMQVKKTATASVSTSCGDNTGLADCKRKSQKDAETKIAEQGSVVLVDSLTEVRNFKLTKEELRSQVSAQLSDVQVDQKPSMNPDTGSITVLTRISASVTPAINPAFRDQLRSSVRADLVARAGGPLDFSALGGDAAAAPAAGTDDAAARRDEEEQRRQAQQRRLDDERRQLDAERAQLAERRRREEAERADQERRDREAAEAAAQRRKGTFTPTF